MRLCKNWLCSEVQLFMLYGDADKDGEPLAWMISMIDRFNRYHRRVS